MKFITKNSKKALPYNYYYYPVIFLSLSGIVNCIYLALSHYWNYVNISYASFCAISKAINCDTVSQSSWSIVFNIPVAVWGLFGYLLFLIFLIPLHSNIKSNRPFWALLFLIASIFSILAFFFGYISATKIKAYCILCILSYAISFSLLFYSLIIFKRFCHGSLFLNLKQIPSLLTQSIYLKYSLIVLLGMCFCVKIFIPHYWQFKLPELDSSSAQGYTIDQHPWIGAISPKLTIHEFSDYQCFQCAKMHSYLRRLINDYPDEIRLVHHNYPMDHEVNPRVVPEPFHIGSGRLALLSIAAQKQNKFWEVNDVIYSMIRKQQDNIKVEDVAELAQADSQILLKEMFSKKTLKLLEKDIRLGLKFEITSTPTFIIDEKKYVGSIPPEHLKKITSE